MKKCRICGTEKKPSEYYKDVRLISGRLSVCKICVQARQQKYRTPERERQYNKTARLKIINDPVKYAKLLKYQRNLYKVNGRRKFPNKCSVCNKLFYSVRKDRKFCSPKCISTGINNGRWLGGRQVTSSGYVTIYSPHHPHKSIRNWVLEHRLVMENNLGRFLNPQEVVHHKNGIKSDNRIDNLLLLKNTSEHTKLHTKKGIKGTIKLK